MQHGLEHGLDTPCGQEENHHLSLIRAVRVWRGAFFAVKTTENSTKRCTFAGFSEPKKLCVIGVSAPHSESVCAKSIFRGIRNHPRIGGVFRTTAKAGTRILLLREQQSPELGKRTVVETASRASGFLRYCFIFISTRA